MMQQYELIWNMRHLSDIVSHGYDHIAHHEERQACIAQSCPRVGWTRGSGRVGSGRVTILPDFVGSGRVSTFDLLGFTGYFLVPESIRIFEYYIQFDWFLSIFNI